MLEAEVCEEFHLKNDYKLNNINKFWDDHISKHIIQYNECTNAV